MTKTFIAALCTVAAFTFTGCPTVPGTFEVWVVNTSGTVTVTNVKLVNDADMDDFREFPADQDPATARVLTNVPLGDLEGNTITVEVTGETGGQVLEDVDADIRVPDALQSGSVLVIVLGGDNIVSFSGEYIPLEDASKGELMFRNHLLGAL